MYSQLDLVYPYLQHMVLCADLNDHSGPEVDVEGWNARPGEYAFLYAYERAEDNRGGAGAGTLLLKCLAIAGDTLLAVSVERGAPSRRRTDVQGRLDLWPEREGVCMCAMLGVEAHVQCRTTDLLNML